MKHILSVIVLICMGGIYVGIQNAAARTIEKPFTEVQNQLMAALHIQLDDFDRHGPQARSPNGLAHVMSMNLYATQLEMHIQGEALTLLCKHTYNIGANGGEYIRFKIKKIDENRTSVKVDYSDRWAGMWPPFLFWNPGWVRESRIVTHIFLTP